MSGTRDDPTVVERIDDVEKLLASPGYYQTTSTFPAYTVAKALDGWHPLFRGGMDMPFVEGSVFFFRVLEGPEDMRRNALVAMGVSPDFWGKMLQRYTHWELAWWREVVQNARDANATQIDLDIQQGRYVDIETGAEADAMVVSAYDNGTGMDAATLRKARLTRGGSVKPESAVGGFGDAKNLILFPWLGWKVETRNLVAQGQHESVQEPPGVHEMSQGIQGTRITVWMPLTQTTTAAFAEQLVERSFLPDVRVRVNGKKVAADLIGGEEVAKATITNPQTGTPIGTVFAHHQPRARTHTGVFIRARGVFMFESYAPKVPGVVYIDLNVPARFAFDASRNSLVGGPRDFVDSLVRRLIKEPEGVLRSKKWMMEKVYRGTGTISVREGKAAETAAKAVARVQDQLAKKQTEKKPPTQEMAKEVADEVGRAMEEQERDEAPPATPEQQTASNLKSSRDTASMLITHFMPRAVTEEQVANAARFAAWQPDLYIVQNLPFWKAPAAVLPEKMADKYLVLLRLWTEVCKFGMVQLGEFQPFGVGFVFMLDGITDQPVLGAHKLHESTHWLMINPLKFKRGPYDYEARAHKWEDDGDRLDLSTEHGLEDICATSIHEITHLQGFADHDQAYASALTQNIKIALRGMRELAQEQLKQIRREVRERKGLAPAKEPEPERAKPTRELPGFMRAEQIPGSLDSYRQLAALVVAFGGLEVALGGGAVPMGRITQAGSDFGYYIASKVSLAGVSVGDAFADAVRTISRQSAHVPLRATTPKLNELAQAGRQAWAAMAGAVTRKLGAEAVDQLGSAIQKQSEQIAEALAAAYDVS